VNVKKYKITERIIFEKIVPFGNRDKNKKKKQEEINLFVFVVYNKK
jgi:hypothetical protein